jgi:hypothetical protein
MPLYSSADSGAATMTLNCARARHAVSAAPAARRAPTGEPPCSRALAASPACVGHQARLLLV